jgi:hypothetical protein
MRYSTAYNHLKRLQARLDSIYSAALCYHPTHAELLVQIKNEIWGDKALPRCPGWVQQLLSERSGIHFNNIQRHWIVWLFETAPGQATSWDNLDEKTRADYCKLNGKTGYHFWLKEVHQNKLNCSTGDTITRQFVVTNKKW